MVNIDCIRLREKPQTLKCYADRSRTSVKEQKDV